MRRVLFKELEMTGGERAVLELGSQLLHEDILDDYPHQEEAADDGGSEGGPLVKKKTVLPKI